MVQAIKVDEIEKYLGKPVNDPYGRRYGYVISFYSDSDGYVTALEISVGDMEYREIPIDRFIFNNGEIVIMPEWEYQAKLIESRLDRLRKRISALNELYAKKEIPKHAFEGYKKTVEDELIKTKEDARKICELLKKRMSELDNMMVELEKSITSLKMLYLAGEIDDKSYKTASDQIRKYLEIVIAEKDSVKKHLELIDKLEKQPVDVGVKITQETSISSEQEVKENQSIPVVVLET